MLYMVTFTINIPPMLAYIPAPWIHMDPMGYGNPQYWAMSSQPHAVIQGVACSLSPPRGAWAAAARAARRHEAAQRGRMQRREGIHRWPPSLKPFGIPRDMEFIS